MQTPPPDRTARAVDAVTTVLEVLGMAAVAVGAGLVYLPAGIIAAGVALVLLGWLGSRPPATPDDLVDVVLEQARQRAGRP